MIVTHTHTHIEKEENDSLFGLPIQFEIILRPPQLVQFIISF